MLDAIEKKNCRQLFTGQPPSIAYSSTSTQPPDLLSARLGISILEQNVQFYLRSAISNNTMCSYTCTHRRYLNFCSQFRISQPYPTSESILCQFTGYLGRQHLKYQTIKCYLSSIRYFQIMQSYQDPFLHNLPRLHYVLRESEGKSPISPMAPSNPSSILLQIVIYYSLIQQILTILCFGRPF